METNKQIVLDANILMRAVLGQKVKPLLEKHYADVQFFTPEVCYQDAKKYLPPLFKKKNLEERDAIEALDELWTEDADFFGAGVATWTSDSPLERLRQRVHLYLSS